MTIDISPRVKTLRVNTPQGTAGILEKESRHVFAYGTTEPQTEVSLTMPLRRESYASTAMLPAFSMNRPEGFLLERIQRAFKHVRLDDMALLAITGANQIGRLRFEEPGAARHLRRPQVGLREIIANGNQGALFETLVQNYLDTGISGFQPKVVVPDADRIPQSDEKATLATPTLILKTAGDDYPNLVANEYMCMSVARHARMPVPSFWISNDQSLFAMQRFDLDDLDRNRQLGFEDMAVLMGRSPMEPNFKYASSYEMIARAIAANCAENTDSSLADLYSYVALSVMVRNGDAHLKNFGLLYDHPGGQAPRLAPVFDVVTTSVYAHENQRTGVASYDHTMALRLNRSVSYPTRDELLEFGRKTCHVARPEVVLESIADSMAAVWAENAGRLPHAFEAQLQAQWDAGRLAVSAARTSRPRPTRATRG
jgi:serine/threonine-protein kinase HipA